MRLVPKNNNMGWATYALLGYLGFLLIDPVMSHAGWTTWAWTGLGILLFLVPYFTLFWVCGWKTLACCFAIVLLGVAYLPFNSGACCFFIYAGSFLAFEEKASTSFKLIGAIALVLACELYLLRSPAVTWFVDIGLLLMIGVLNVYFSQRGRAQKKLIRAQEEIEHLAKIAERERIARDLHDVLGHTLSLIVIKSELASKLAERGDERAAVEIRDVEKIARESLAELREALSGYRAAGIAAEVERARSTLESAGIAVDYAGEELRLPAAQETVLSLALREGVTNVVRHARATTCRLRLAQLPELCRLEIADDGTGGGEREGMGLLGMRERVEALGGHVRRDRASGTHLTIELPTA